jgi:hypothetical protein
MKNTLWIKNIFTALLILSFSQIFAQQQNNPVVASFQIKEKQNNSISIQFTSGPYQMTKEIIHGIEMDKVSLSGIILPNNAGAPDLPGLSQLIAIPQGATAELSVISYQTEEIDNVDIAPAPVIPWDTDKEPLNYTKDSRIYNKNEFYPANPFLISDPMKLRGIDAVMLGITPFQYNPVTKKMIIYTDVEVEITFNGGNGNYGDNKYRSRWFDPILEDHLLNFSDLPKMSYSLNLSTTDATGYEYLIICPTGADFQQWADSIWKFRTEQGIYTGIVTLNNIPNGNTAAGLETFINNAYNNWDIPPVAILILGDYGTNITNSVISPIYNSYCVSDNVLGDVDGDFLPEIVMARMTANNATELQTMCTKFLNYERNPPTSAAFYDNPITALGWQDDRWFQLGSEVVGGYFRSIGKNPVRINALGSPADNTGNNIPGTGIWSTTDPSAIISYFGTAGLNYIPNYPGTLGGFSGGTPAQVVTAINNGSFILQHRDHGAETGWGEPAFDNTNISSLTNTDLTFIMSINCLTGKYDYASECFAEKFHRYKFGGNNSGALGLIAASEVSYSFVNDTYIWGIYDNLFPDFMPAYGTTPASRGVLPAFGNAAGKIFLAASSWPYNTGDKEVTYNLFHMHGDAFQTVYSEVPQSLTVVHPATIIAGVTSVNVSADAGALIALTYNGVILATATATGSTQALTIPAQFPPTVIKVVATKQNYLRYEGSIIVIAGTTPYVIVYNHSTSAPPQYGQSIGLNVELKNVADSPYDAINVDATLSTTNPYITITDATENYGDIAAGATVLINGAFTISIADSIPDQTEVVFNVNATGTYSSTPYTWDTPLHITVASPLLNCGNILIQDPTGNNNGRLDPGESAQMNITTSNTGHADISNVQATLTTTNPNVNITGSPQNITIITAGGSQVPVFGVSVSSLATTGEVATFIYTAVSGDYIVYDTIHQVIGLVSEDWETGNFLKFPWVNTSSIPWTITTTLPYEGTHCAQSGAISDNGITEFHITRTVLMNDSISFYRKVSSENTWDFLRFYIDGNLQEEWSGEVTWGRAVYPVNAGSRIFKWAYEKDYSYSSGSDKAWVDYILFPPVDLMVSINEIPTSEDWHLFPNPNNGQFVLTGNTLINQTIEISVFNSIGMCVYEQSNIKMNTNTFNINLPNAAAGMYLLKINGDKTQTTLPVIVK